MSTPEELAASIIELVHGHRWIEDGDPSLRGQLWPVLCDAIRADRAAVVAAERVGFARLADQHFALGTDCKEFAESVRAHAGLGPEE